MTPSAAGIATEWSYERDFHADHNRLAEEPSEQSTLNYYSKIKNTGGKRLRDGSHDTVEVARSTGEYRRIAWNAVCEIFEERDVTWREAAYIVALSRIAEAHETRGLWP